MGIGSDFFSKILSVASLQLRDFRLTRGNTQAKTPSFN